MNSIKPVSTFVILLGVALLGVIAGTPAAARPAAPEAAFAAPPDSARPQTFWFWLSPTREGITKDLEEMRHQGINGYVLMNLGDASVWAAAPPFMGPQWHALFRHALAETHRLGLDAIVHNCDGFQE